jgi:serine/threonine protein kinase
LSLTEQRIGSYRLVHKIYADQNDKIYQAEHLISFKKCIFQLAKLEGKLNKKASRVRLERKIEAIRATNSPSIIPILKCDFAELNRNNYFYIRTANLNASCLKEWLEQDERRSLTQQCVDDIMRQVREAVDVFHRANIAHLNIGLSSFVLVTGEGTNGLRVYLNCFLPAVLYSESIRENKKKRKKAFTEDRIALDDLEKLLNEEVEKAGLEHTAHLESTLKVLEKRLLIVEAQNEQVQQRLRELEAEKERINREVQELREEEKKRLLQEEERERMLLDQQEQKESVVEPVAGMMLASAAIRSVDVPSPTFAGVNPSYSSRKWTMVSGCLLFLAVLFAGATCIFAVLFFFGKPVLAYFDSSTARVTITQASYALSDNYVFTGVSHSISKATTQSITVPATNVVVIPGNNATGTLTFHNTQTPCNLARVIPAGTLFTNAQGISVATDKAVILGTACNATAPAHAVRIGPIGNISAHSIKQAYLTSLIVDNPSAFAGGQFAQSYTTVQQGDIDQASSSLKGRIKQESLSALHKQLQTNEQYTSLPTCASKDTSNHQANDVATQVTVTVTVACTAEVYNPVEIQSRSLQMLNTRAESLFGPNYMLSGNIQATITHIATDAKHNTIVTTVASGLWAYRVSRAHSNKLAQILTGNDKRDAQSIVSGQNGVQSVSISISNNGNTMPSKANSIHIAYVTSLVVVKGG